MHKEKKKKMYRLKIIQSRRFNDVLTRGEVILCGDVLNAYLSLFIWHAQRWHNLQPDTSCRATPRARRRTHLDITFQVFKTLSQCHPYFESPLGTTYQNVTPRDSTSHNARLRSLTLPEADNHTTSLPLKSILVLEEQIPFLLEEADSLSPSKK